MATPAPHAPAAATGSARAAAPVPAAPQPQLQVQPQGQGQGQGHPQGQGLPLPLTPSAVSDGVHVIDGPHGRILCIADVRGKLSLLNQLATETQADAVIHTGDFAFYEPSSLERISDRTLRHLIQYSPLIPEHERSRLLGLEGGTGPTAASALRTAVAQQGTPALLSEFPQLLSGQLQLKVPVFTVWGACEDVEVLEKFRTGEYSVHNLHVLDEATTRAIEVGGVRLRLLGLGGTVVMHKLFDNGLGNATIAGGQGTMWTTLLQIGELIDTAQKVYDASETRLLLTHVSPGREGLLALLAIALRADLTISAGLHFRYTVSYNEFNVQHDPDNFRAKLIASRNAFYEVWDTVKSKVEEVIDDHQRVLLRNALAVINRIPGGGPTPSGPGQAHSHSSAAEEATWKNIWNWNLPDAAHGSLALDINQGRISATTKSQGFNFAYRRAGHATAVVKPPVGSNVANNSTLQPTQTSGVPLSAAPSSLPKQPPAARGPAPWDRNTSAPTPASTGPTPTNPRLGGSNVPATARGTNGTNEPPLSLHMAGLGPALPVGEDAILAYFPPSITKSITHVSLPQQNPRGSRSGGDHTDSESRGPTGQKPFAYVSFTSEEVLQAALQHAASRPILTTKEGKTCTPSLERALRSKREPRILSGDVRERERGSAKGKSPSLRAARRSATRTVRRMSSLRTRSKRARLRFRAQTRIRPTSVIVVPVAAKARKSLTRRTGPRRLCLRTRVSLMTNRLTKLRTSRQTSWQANRRSMIRNLATRRPSLSPSRTPRRPSRMERTTRLRRRESLRPRKRTSLTTRIPSRRPSTSRSPKPNLRPRRRLRRRPKRMPRRSPQRRPSQRPIKVEEA